MLNPETRIAELASLGFSQSVLEMSTERKPHHLFEGLCSDPYYIYHGGTTPFDLPVVPMWEDGMMLTAAWEFEGIKEIIQFSLESPDEYSVIAYTEQGLWADFFASMIDDGWAGIERDIKLVREAAAVVGFSSLEETIKFVETNCENPRYPEPLNEFTKSI